MSEPADETVNSAGLHSWDQQVIQKIQVESRADRGGNLEREGNPKVVEHASVIASTGLNSSMDAPATSNTSAAGAGADGAQLGAKTPAVGVITSSSDRRPISPSPPPPPPPYKAALSMPLSPKRYSPTVDSRLTPPATAGPPAAGAGAGAAGAAKRGAPTTAGWVDSSSIRVTPSPPPSYISWKSSSKPRVKTASLPGATGAGAGDGVLPMPPPPPPYEQIFSPAVDKTSAAEQEQEQEQTRVAEDDSAAGLPLGADAASNMIQDVAEDVAESVADVFHAIGSVFGGRDTRKDGPDVATMTTGKESFVADVEADSLDEDDGDGDGKGDGGTARQPGFAASANLDQGVSSGLPPSSSAASAPNAPSKGGGFSGVFGALKGLGVPTTGDTTGHEAGRKEERAEEQKPPPEKKKDIGGSAVSRLRQMFERNNSDSKKRASLEARPLRRPVTALAVSSIGEHKPAVGQTTAAEPVKAAAKEEFAVVAADASGATKSADEHAAPTEEGVPSATASSSAQGGGSVLKWPALRQPVARTEAASSKKAPGPPYVAAARVSKVSEEEQEAPKPYVSTTEMPVVSSPADEMCEGGHAPTEEMMPAPTEDSAPTKPAVKAPKFGASLQNLFFGSAKEEETPKVPASSVGGLIPSAETLAKGVEEDSPVENVMGASGATGAKHGLRVDELAFAATGAPADNNKITTISGVAGDMTTAPLAGDVPTEGVLKPPATLRSSDGLFSAPSPPAAAAAAPALAQDTGAPPLFDTSLASSSVQPASDGGGLSPGGGNPVAANGASAFAAAAPEMSVSESVVSQLVGLGSSTKHAESSPAVVSSPAVGVDEPDATVDQVSSVEGMGLEQPGGLAEKEVAAVAGVVETAVSVADAAVGVPGLLEPSVAVASFVPEVDGVGQAGVTADYAAEDNEDLPVEQQQLMGNTVDGAAIEDGPETRPEQQQPVSVNEAVVGVNAVAAVESAAALSSSPDGVPGADAEEPSPNAVVSGGVASMESACATGAEVANDDSTAVAMSAQAVSADGPTAPSLEHEVEVEEDKEVGVAGPAVGSSSLPEGEGPVAAMVSAVAEAVSDAIEAVTDQLVPTDAAGCIGGDEESSPVVGLDASASPIGVAANNDPAGAVAAAAEGAAATGDCIPVTGEVLSALPAGEEGEAALSVGMKNVPVPSSPHVDGSAGFVASSVPLEDEAADGTPLVDGTVDTPAVNPASLVAGLSSEESLPPAADDMLIVDDTAPIPSAEYVDNDTAAMGGKVEEQEERKKIDPAPFDRGAELRQMFGQYTQVEAVKAEVVPGRMSAAGESIDAPLLDVGSSLDSGSVPAMESTSAPDVDGVAATVGKISPVEGGEVEQPGGLAEGEGAAIAGVTEDIPGAVEDASFDMPGLLETNLAVSPELPEVDGVEQAGTMVEDVAVAEAGHDSCNGLPYGGASVENRFPFVLVPAPSNQHTLFVIAEVNDMNPAQSPAPQDTTDSPVEQRPIEQTTDDAAIEATPEVQQPVGVAAAMADPSGEDAVAEIVVDETMPTPLESGCVGTEQPDPAAIDEVADDATAPVEMKTATDGDDTAVPPQIAGVVGAGGEVQPTAGDAAIDDGPETGSEQWPVSVTETVMEGDAVAAAGSAAAFSSYLDGVDGVPGADAEETQSDAVMTEGTESMEQACATGVKVADDADTAVATSAQVVGAGDPTAASSDQQVGGVEDKDVDLTGPAVGSSPLPGGEAPVAAMVSAVAEAVSDAIEAVTDQLAPTDAAVSVGDDEDGGPVVGLGACGSLIGASAEDKPAGAATVAVEGAAATGNNVPVVGEVEAVVPAEEGAADPAVGMEERPVSTPASVGGSAAAVVASSVSLEDEAAHDAVVLEGAVDTPTVTLASLVGGLNSEQSLPPSGDGLLAGTGTGIAAAAGDEEGMASPPMVMVDDTVPTPSAESVEFAGEGAGGGSAAVGSKKEEGQTTDAAPLSRVAELRRMFVQSTPVETVGGAVVPEMVSAAAESVDSPLLDVGPPEYTDSVLAVDIEPAADLNGALSTAGDEVSPIKEGNLEQPIGLAVEEGVDVTGVVEETLGAVEDAAVMVPGPPSEPSMAGPFEVPEVDEVDQAGVTVEDVAEDTADAPFEQQLTEQTADDAAIEAAPEVRQPVAVAAATVPACDDAVAETIVEDVIPTPLESGSMGAEQPASAAVEEAADAGTAPMKTKTATDGDIAAVPPQSAAVVGAGEVQPTQGSAATNDGPDTGPEQQLVSVTEAVVAVEVGGPAAAFSSSLDGVPVAVAEETSPDDIGSAVVESMEQACATGAGVADDNGATEETSAQAVGAGDPTAAIFNQQVGGVEDKDVDLTGPAVGSSPLPGGEAPVAAMVSAVAEAVSDAIEAVTDQLAPTDAAVSVGDDEDGGPVVGLGACGSPIGASAEDKPAGAATVAVEGAAATGNNVPVVGEVEAVVPAEEGAADPAVGMEERPVSTPASVGGSAAAVVASYVSLEGEVIDGAPVVEAADDTPAVTPASLVGGLSSEQSLPPSGDGLLAGTGTGIAAAAGDEEVRASLPMVMVDDTASTPSAESVEVAGESYPEATGSAAAVVGDEREREQTIDAVPLSRVAELREMFGQSTPVETVGGKLVPEMVSAAVESVDSPPLDVGPPEHAGSVPAVDSMPAADVDGALSTTVGKISSAEGSELEQPVGVAGEQGAAVTGVLEETTGAVEDAAVDVPGAKAPSSAALSEVPEVGGVDQAGVTVDNATEDTTDPSVEQPMAQTANDAAVDAAPEVQQPVAVAVAAAAPSSDDAVAETVVDETMSTPVESGSVNEVADDITAPLETKTAPDGDDTDVLPQSDDGVEAGEQPVAGDAAVDVGPETRSEQQSMSVTESVVEGNAAAVAAAGSATAFSSSPDGVPVAVAEEPSPNAVGSGVDESTELACTTGAEVADDNETAVAMSAQVATADDPTVVSLEQEVEGVEGKGVDVTGPAAGSSPLPGDEGPVAAMVSAVAEAVSDAIETVTDQLVPTDTAGCIGDGGPVFGLDASGSPTNASAEDELAGAMAAAAEGASAAGDEMMVTGAVEPVMPAEEMAAALSVGMEDVPVSSPASVGDSVAVAASSVPLEDKVADGAPVVEGAADIPAMTPASLVGGLSLEESQPPAGDDVLAGSGSDAMAAAGDEEMTASPPVLMVDDTVPGVSAEGVEVAGEAAAASAFSSSPDGAPGADAGGPFAQGIGADDPTAVCSDQDQQVEGEEDKEVGVTGPAVGSSSLPVAAMVSAVAEAVSDAIEAVTDHLTPSDATGSVGDDEDGGPVVGLGASGGPTDASAEDEPTGSVTTAALEGAAVAGDNIPVIGEVEPAMSAEVVSATLSVGMGDGAVSTPASVVDSAAVVVPTVSLEEAAEGAPAVEGTVDTQAATLASLVGGLISKEPLPPAGYDDDMVTGASADVTGKVADEEVKASSPTSVVDDDDMAPGASAESVELTYEAADDGSAVEGGKEEEEEEEEGGQKIDPAPLSRVAELCQMFGQSAPVETVVGAVVPEMVSSAAESIDSPPLDVGSPLEHMGSVPAVDVAPATGVDGLVATVVDEVSPVEEGELEQAVGLAGEQDASITGVVQETAGVVEDAAADVPGLLEPSMVVASEVPEVDVVDQAGATVDDATEDTADAPVEQQLTEQIANDAAIDAAPEVQQPVAVAVAAAVPCGDTAAAETDETMPMLLESGCVEAEQPVSAAVEEVADDAMVPVEVKAATDGDDTDATLQSADVVEGGAVQPTADDTIVDAGPEAGPVQQLVSVMEVVVEGGAVAAAGSAVAFSSSPDGASGALVDETSTDGMGSVVAESTQVAWAAGDEVANEDSTAMTGGIESNEPAWATEVEVVDDDGTAMATSAQVVGANGPTASLESEAVDGAAVVEDAVDTSAVTPVSLVGDLSSEESLPPAADDMLAGPGADVTPAAGDEVTASPAMLMVDDTAPTPSVEGVEIAGESYPEAADSGTTAVGSSKEEERQTADAAPLSRVAELRRMFGQSARVDTVGGAVAPEMVSAAASASVDSPPLDVGSPPEHTGSVPAVEIEPATGVDGPAAAVVDEVSPVEEGELEQPVGVEEGEGAVVAGVVEEMTVSVEVSKPPSVPSMAVPSEVPEMDGVDHVEGAVDEGAQQDKAEPPVQQQPMEYTAEDAAPEVQEPVGVAAAAAAVPSGDSAVAETVVDEAMSTPLESGRVEAEQPASAVAESLADDGADPVGTTTPTDGDGDITSASPQSDVGEEVGEAETSPGSEANDDGPETGPEQHPLSAAASPSSSSGVPGAIVDEMSTDGVGPAVAASTQAAGAAGVEVANDGSTAMTTPAQAVGADDPTSMCLEHKVEGEEDKEVGVIGPAAGSSPLPEDDGPVAAMVSAVAEAVSDAIETVTDQLAPSDENSSPVLGLDASSSPTDETTDGDPAVAAAGSEGSEATGDEMTVMEVQPVVPAGEVQQVVPAEEIAAEPSVGKEDGTVTSPPSVRDPPGMAISSGSLGYEAVNGATVVEGAVDTPAVTLVPLVGDLSSEESRAPAGDGVLAGTSADVIPVVGDEEVTAPPPMLVVDDTVPGASAEGVEFAGESYPEAAGCDSAAVGSKKEEGQTTDAAPVSRVAALPEMFDQSTPVETVGGAVVPEIVSAVAESVDSPPLDVGSPLERTGSVLAVDIAPGTGVDGLVATVVDKASPVEVGELEQPGGVVEEQDAAVPGLVEETAGVVEDAAVDVPGLLEPSLAAPSDVPGVDFVDQPTVDDVAEDTSDSSVEQQPMKQTADDAAIDAAPEVKQPVAVAVAAAVPSDDTTVAETVVDETMPTPLESGCVDAEQPVFVAVGEVAGDMPVSVEMKAAATDDKETALSPQSADVVEAGEVQPTADDTAIDVGPETEPEQQLVSVTEAVVEGGAVATAGSAAAFSSSPNGAPGADVEEPFPDAVGSVGVETIESACTTGAEVTDDNDTAVAMSAQAVGADDPTVSAVYLDHEVKGEENKEVGVAGPAVGSSPLPGSEGPVAAMVSAVAEAVSGTIETVANHLTDAAVSVGDDGDSGPVFGLGTSARPTNESVDDEPPGVVAAAAVAAAVGGAAREGSDMAVMMDGVSSEVNSAMPAEEGGLDHCAGMEERPVSSLASVDNSAVVAGSVSFEDEAVDGAPVVEGAVDTPTVTLASMVGGFSSEVSLRPAGNDGDLWGTTGAGVKPVSGDVKVMVSPEPFAVDDTAPTPSAEGVELTSKSHPQVAHSSPAAVGRKKEDGQTIDATPLSQVAELRQMSGQSTRVETVGGGIFPDMVSAAAESVDSPPLDVGSSPEHTGSSSVPAVDSMPATGVDGPAATVVDEISPVEGGELEQRDAVVEEQGTPLAGVVVEKAEAVEGTAVEVSDPLEPSLAVTSEVPGVDVVDHAGVPVCDLSEDTAGSPIEPQPIGEAVDDVAVDAAPETGREQPVPVAVAVPSCDDVVAEIVADEAIPSPLELGCVEAEQATSAAMDEVADDDDAMAPVKMMTVTDGDDTAASPQSADVVEAEVQPAAGDATVEDALETGPEQQPVTVTQAVMEVDAVGAVESAAVSSSSPDGVPGADAGGPFAQGVDANDPTAASSDQQVEGEEDDVPVAAMVSAVAEAVSDAIEAVTDHLTPSDATGSVGDDEDCGPVLGLDASGSPIDASADGESAGAMAAVGAAVEGAAVAGDETAVMVDGMTGEVEPVAPAEEVSGDPSVGMDGVLVSPPPAEGDSPAKALSASLGDEDAGGASAEHFVLVSGVDNLATAPAALADSDAKLSSGGIGRNNAESMDAAPLNVAKATTQQGPVAETSVGAPDGVVSSCSVLDATAPTAGIEGSLPAVTDELLQEAVVVEAGAPEAGRESSAEKTKRKGMGMGKFGFFLPQLLGWDKQDKEGKQDKPHSSRAGRAEDEGAASPVAETAAQGPALAATAASVSDDQARSEGAAAPSPSLPFTTGGLAPVADDGEAPAAAKMEDEIPSPSPSSSPPAAEQNSVGIDAAAISPEAGAAMGVKPFRDEDAPVLVVEGGMLTTTQQEEQPGPMLEVGDSDGRKPAAATPSLNTAASLGEPPSGKKKHHRGFSLPMLFGWGRGRGREDKPHTRAGSEGSGVTMAEAADDVSEPARVADNPPAGAAATSAAAPEDGMMSAVADAVSDAVEVVSDAIETAAGALAPGDVEQEQAPLPATRGTGAATATAKGGIETSTSALSLKIPISPTRATTDVYNLKVQVGAEHAFPVVALDAPVAGVSPLARHFSEHGPEEGSSVVAVLPSTSPSAEINIPASHVDIDEAITAGGSPAQEVDVAATGEKGQSEDPFLVPADSTANIEAAAAASAVAAAAAERPGGVDICGITDDGIADTTAAFGVVDLSKLLEEEVADRRSTLPSCKAPAPATTVKSARRSLSPGWKGFAATVDDSGDKSKKAGVTGAANRAKVPLQALPGSAEAAVDPYAGSPPDTPAVNVCSPNKQDCVIM